MFGLENLTDDKGRTFYAITAGAYDSIIEMIEDYKEKLIQLEKDYKEFKFESDKKNIKFYKERISTMTIEKELLERLYTSLEKRY